MALTPAKKPKTVRIPPNVDIFKKEDFGNKEINDKFQEIQNNLKQSLKNKKERDQIYKCYIDLAAAYYRLFRYDEAEACCWRHLSMAQEKKFLNEEQVKTALTNLGTILKRKLLYEEALNHYKTALEIAEKIEDIRAYARILNNMGNVYEAQLEFDSAIECFEKRAEISTDLGDVDGQIKAFACLGSLYHLKGELRRSILYYEKVIINVRMKLGKARYTICLQIRERKYSKKPRT